MGRLPRAGLIRWTSFLWPPFSNPFKATSLAGRSQCRPRAAPRHSAPGPSEFGSGLERRTTCADLFFGGPLRKVAFPRAPNKNSLWAAGHEPSQRRSCECGEFPQYYPSLSFFGGGFPTKIYRKKLVALLEPLKSGGSSAIAPCCWSEGPGLQQPALDPA